MHVAHPPTASRRRLNFDSFEEVLDEVRKLQRGCGKTGQWNLAQCCHHLAAAMNAQIDGGVNKAPWPARMVARFFLRDAMFRSGRIRSGVPSPLEMDKNVGDEEQEIASLAAAMERVRNHQGPSHAHPFFGKLSPEQWRQFHLIHCAHHLGFLVPREMGR